MITEHRTCARPGAEPFRILSKYCCHSHLQTRQARPGGVKKAARGARLEAVLLRLGQSVRPQAHSGHTEAALKGGGWKVMPSAWLRKVTSCVLNILRLKSLWDIMIYRISAEGRAKTLELRSSVLG